MMVIAEWISNITQLFTGAFAMVMVVSATIGLTAMMAYFIGAIVRAFIEEILHR